MARVRTRGSTTRSDVVMLVLGIVYLALSVIGFATVGWQEIGWEDPVRMLGFLGVSSLLNIVHGLIGLVLIGMSLRHWSVGIAPVAAVAFIAMAAFGAVARIFGGEGDPLNLNWWNVGLYVLSAAAAVYAYTTGVRRHAA